MEFVFYLSILKLWFQCLWSPLNEKSAINSFRMYLMNCLPLALFRITSLSLPLSSLLMVGLDVGLFVFTIWEFTELLGIWVNVIYQIWNFLRFYFFIIYLTQREREHKHGERQREKEKKTLH